MKQKLKKKCKNCGKTFITFDESVEFCNLGCKEDYANPPIEAIPESKRAKKMNTKLTEFLEERQRQLFMEKTDMYGRFKTSDGKSFWEGYVECLQDIYNFFEVKKMEQGLKRKNKGRGQ